MAGNRSLGVLTLDLVAKIGGFVSGMSAAERETDKRLKGIQKKVSSFASSIGNAIGVSAGLSISGALAGGIAALTTAINRMDELRDMSVRLGVAVETLSAFSFAAQQTGTNIEELGKGFRILAKNAADALNPKSSKFELFEALNVDVADAQGNLRSLDQIMFNVADRFAALEDGTTKAALAQELFGKSGGSLIEFLNQGGRGLEEMTERARELGLVIDQESADKADLFNDTLNELKGSLTGVASKVADALIPQLVEMTNQTIDWINEGETAEEVANQLASGIDGIAQSIKALGQVFGVLDDLKNKLSDIQNFMVRTSPITKLREMFQEAVWGQSGEWDINGFIANQRKGPTPDVNIPGMQFSIPGLSSSRVSVVPLSALDARAVSSGGFNRAALNRALAGISDKDKAKKGKSEEEKAAERLAKAINQMTDAQRQWQTELDGTGNQIADKYAKRLDEITEKSEDFIQNGIPKERVAEFRQEMTRLADALKEKETAEYLKEFSYQTEEMIANANGASTAYIEYARAVEELDKALQSGIISQEEFVQRSEALAKVRDAGPTQVLRDIEEQRQLLGQTAEYQDTYNKLKYAGVDANSAWGQSIIEANKALYDEYERMSDRIELMDTVRDFTTDMAMDLASATSSWESFGDAIDDVAKKLLQMVVQNLVEKALGQFGTASTGSSGGWLSTIAGWMFGGGGSGGGASTAVGPRASGGYSAPWSMFQVNELGPELATVGGRSYLMTGDQPAYVTNAQDTKRMLGGDFVNNQTIVVQGRITNATAKQIAQKTATEGQRQMSRYGVY